MMPVLRAAKERRARLHPPGCICNRCVLGRARDEWDAARRAFDRSAELLRRIGDDLDQRGRLIAIRRQLLADGVELDRGARLLHVRQDGPPPAAAPSDAYRGGVPAEAKPRGRGRRSWWERALCIVGVHRVDALGKGDVKTAVGILHDLDVEVCRCGAWRIVVDERRFSWRR
jgi:hypothetical protein